MGSNLSTPEGNAVDLESELLNSYNTTKHSPQNSDIVVVGGGIHSLIYAIHVKVKELRDAKGQFKMYFASETRQPGRCLMLGPEALLTDNSSPGYKIGESTLTVFGLWLKMVGIDSPMLARLFGPKDGLAFYYFSSLGDPEDYTQFIANGPPADFVPTLQVERKISELMLTLFAQRLGISIFHGREVMVDNSTPAHHEAGMTLQVRDCATKSLSPVQAQLVVDASGRFHRFASKASRIERPESFNTSAFWAYWECPCDENEIDLRDYESVNTNHLCVAEGWAWVIRLPTWEGSPLPNLINMINHLLDLNAAKTPADEYPSAAELVKTFQLKMRWVVSIGFALRSDVVYPDDLTQYGSIEAEQKFNWVVSKYEKISKLMAKHTLIRDLYGPGTTWFVRKNIGYRSPNVTGRDWMAVGDATGFTNPLYSPGINANMGTSIYAAEMSRNYLALQDRTAKDKLLMKYETFCKNRIPNLQRMNTFNYVCMRSPDLGPLGPLWQYLIGTGNKAFQTAKSYNFENCRELLTEWDWGANQEEYITISRMVIMMLEGRCHEQLSQEQIDGVKEVSRHFLKTVMANGEYHGRWSGLLRYYDDDLQFHKDKVERDVLAKRCKTCGEWKMLQSDVRNCAFCGYRHTVKESTKILYANSTTDLQDQRVLTC